MGPNITISNSTPVTMLKQSSIGVSGGQFYEYAFIATQSTTMFGSSASSESDPHYGALIQID